MGAGRGYFGSVGHYGAALLIIQSHFFKLFTDLTVEKTPPYFYPPQKRKRDTSAFA